MGEHPMKPVTFLIAFLDLRIAGGEADGLRSDVQSGKLARLDGRRELGRAAGDQRRQACILRSASARMADQNKA